MNSFHTLKVHYDSAYAIVGFYRGSSPESIRKVIGKALSLPPKGIKLLTMNGDTIEDFENMTVSDVAVSILTDEITTSVEGPHPSGSMMDRLFVERDNKLSVSHDVLGRIATSDLPDDPAFQGQYVKLERVLSHLANERTWLAWLRAALTLLTTAFMIWQLQGSIENRPLMKQALRWLGNGFILVIPLTAIVGWIRYERTKHILSLSSVSIHHFFGNLGVNVQAWLLGVVLILTVGIYITLGNYYIFSR